MITSVKPMSAAHARALAMAYELHKLLGELYDRPENGEGSCVEFAWDLLDEVIGYLEPFEDEATESNTAGGRMMNLRLQLAEGHITKEAYWRAVDGIAAEKRP
jgi:hypothetical protein